MERKRIWFLLGFMGLLLAACAPKTAGLPTPVGAGTTSQATAPPNIISHTMVPSGAETLCESAFSSPISSGPVSAPLRTLEKQDYGEEGWVFDPNIMSIPHKEPMNAREVIKTLVCIRESRRQETTYADGEPGYRILWDARLVQYPQGVVLAEGNFEGGPPPDAEKWESWKQFQEPPWIGDRPEGSLIEWLFPFLGDQRIISNGFRLYGMALSPDGKLLAAGGPGNIVKIWDASSGQARNPLTLEADRVYVDVLDFSPDGKALAIPAGNVATNIAIQLWNVATGELLLDLTTEDYMATFGIQSLAFSPDGKILASGILDGRVCLWDVAGGQMVKTLSAHKDEVNSLVFSPDGKMLASGSLDGTVVLWDVAAGQALRTLIAHTDGVNEVAFSPDGKLLASGGEDNTTKLWEVATGQLLRTLSSEVPINSVAFSPDGKILASADVREVTLWDVTKGEILRVLEGHRDLIQKVAFSPDGRSLFSGSRDSTLKRWDVATGQ